MNEITLSNDLNVITAEINSYKQVAGQAIFEIGRRLKHVKENDLVHGEFSEWLENIEIHERQAQRMMKVSSELGSKATTWSDLPFRTLYEIATLPPTEREKEHTLSSGETKTPDDMTVRELQEVKRKNKELEQRAKQAEQEKEQAKTQAKTAHDSEQIAIRRLEKLENQEPQVTEKEVIPEKMKAELADREREIGKLKNDLSMLKKRQEYLSEQDEKEKELKHLNYEANKSALTLKLGIDEFLNDFAMTAFRKGAIATSSDGTRQKLRDGIGEMKDFLYEIEVALNGRIDLTKQEAE